MKYIAHAGEEHEAVNDGASHAAAEIAKNSDSGVIIIIVIFLVLATVATFYFNRSGPTNNES
ncbi:hypothetical protein H0X09_03165 [Candidatus Saccharibacteria bacterium]|nr:hypothetical protein [Candidatus Saccharibacteria bacterium]